MRSYPWHARCFTGRADSEMSTMKRPPFMFAAIVIEIFVIFLLAITFWTGVFPGPHLTSNPSSPP